MSRDAALAVGAPDMADLVRAFLLATEGWNTRPASWRTTMSTESRTRTSQEVTLIQAQLQMLADNPHWIARMRGRRELDAVATLPRDSRRPTDPRSDRRYTSDNGTYWQDQSANYAAGLL